MIVFERGEDEKPVGNVFRICLNMKTSIVLAGEE